MPIAHDRHIPIARFPLCHGGRAVADARTMEAVGQGDVAFDLPRRTGNVEMGSSPQPKEKAASLSR